MDITSLLDITNLSDVPMLDSAARTVGSKPWRISGLTGKFRVPFYDVRLYHDVRLFSLVAAIISVIHVAFGGLLFIIQ